MKYTVLIIVIFWLAGCAGSVAIIDKPITFNEERMRLSQLYLSDHYQIQQDNAHIEPKMIVLHWTAIPTFEKSYEAFNPVHLPQARADIQAAGNLNVSAHYLIDRDGSIYQLMPDDLMARHTIGLNHCSIGVENVGDGGEYPLTQDQFRANFQLVKYLKNKYPKIDYLIGHYEYTYFEDHPLWMEQDSAYRTKKTDPGISFMTDIRKRVKSLAFKPNPKPKEVTIHEN